MGAAALRERSAGRDEPGLVGEHDRLDAVAQVELRFGIPLSLASLATGLTLGLGSKWGVLRYRWVTAKLLLNLSVILVGAFLSGPTAAAMVDGRDASEAVLIGASAYDVVALMLATGLSVFKPGRPRSRRVSSPRTSRSLRPARRP